MSYARRLKRSIFFILFFTAIGSIAGLLLRTLLTRSLTVEEYGLFYAVFAFVFFLYAFRDLGVGSALMKYIPEWLVHKKRKRINEGIWDFFLVQAIYTAVLIVALFLLRHYLAGSYFGTPESEPILLVLLVTLMFEFMLTGMAYLFTGFQANGFSTSISAARGVLVIIFTYVFLHAGYGALSPALGYLCSTAILVPLYLLAFKRKCFPELGLPQYNGKLMRELLSYGKYFIIGSLSTILLTSTDTLMITYFLGVKSTGLYSIAVIVVTMLVSVGSLFLMVLLPLSSELHASKKTDLLHTMVTLIYKYFFISVLPLIGLLFAFPNEAISLLFGPEYTQASMALRLLLAGSLAFTFSLFNMGILSGIGHADKQSKILLLIAATNVVLNLVFIPLLGITGAALATAISYTIALLLTVETMRTTMRVHAPWRSWAITLLLTATLVYAADFARKAVQMNNLLEVVIISAAFLLLYGVLSIALGLVKLSELKELLRLAAQKPTPSEPQIPS